MTFLTRGNLSLVSVLWGPMVYFHRCVDDGGWLEVVVVWHPPGGPASVGNVGMGMMLFEGNPPLW